MRRVLIDECINPRLASLLRTAIPDDTIQTVKDLGWSGQRDHVLIPQIQARFDVFVTIDKGFEFEHNLEKISFGIIVLETTNNQMPSYERLLEELVQQIRTAVPGSVVRVIDPVR
jgi:predicted nuclease of predicted toxin-antitoxin system